MLKLLKSLKHSWQLYHAVNALLKIKDIVRQTDERHLLKR